MSLEQQLEVLKRGVDSIISEDELREKLSLGRPLRVKLGVDPTASDVTLGWAVVLRKLRDFQRFGHKASLIVGNFTAQIGDPSGKSKTRKQLTRGEVEDNIESLREQFFKILDPDLTDFYYNADWLEPMSFPEVIQLASRMTVARILERDDFTKRLKEQKPIAMHEILYPLCQGFDSVQIKADVEIGGTDQRFNNLVGRNLQSQYRQSPQVVMLLPLLVGTDGTEKMSQSLGNYVSIVDPPNEIFGKTMSIPDELMRNWFELCTDVPVPEFEALLGDGASPRDAKIRLAKEIVALYHGSNAADAAENYFVETFSKGRTPDEVEEVSLPSSAISDGKLHWPSALKELGLAPSNKEARRLIDQGAVSLDGVAVADLEFEGELSQLVGQVLRVGKKHFRKIR